VTPQITERAEQPYVAIRAHVTMAELSGLADRFGEVFGWLGARGIAPAGAPFFRYNVIDMERQLEVEAGIPVPQVVDGDGPVMSGTLPAGRYATAIHAGPYDGLVPAVAALLAWAAQQDVQWDMTVADDGEHWGSRLEIYLTDPSQLPDPSTWQTELVFRLAD
jgi:effector-binding domain-containing protein